MKLYLNQPKRIKKTLYSNKYLNIAIHCYVYSNYIKVIEGLPCKAVHCEGGGRVGKGREGLIVGYWTQSQARASGGHSRERAE